jgi:hypothetical protein
VLHATKTKAASVSTITFPRKDLITASYSETLSLPLQSCPSLRRHHPRLEFSWLLVQGAMLGYYLQSP